jgi:hypothetical protein
MSFGVIHVSHFMQKIEVPHIWDRAIPDRDAFDRLGWA